MAIVLPEVQLLQAYLNDTPSFAQVRLERRTSGLGILPFKRGEYEPMLLLPALPVVGVVRCPHVEGAERNRVAFELCRVSADERREHRATRGIHGHRQPTRECPW